MPRWWPHRLESVLLAVAPHDPACDAHVLEAWRRILTAAVEFMQAQCDARAALIRLDAPAESAKMRGNDQEWNMIFKAAPMSRAIKVVTAGVLALALAFVAGGLLEKHLPLAGLFVGLIALVCYLLTPIAYETTGEQLTVLLRVGKKSFGPIIGAAPLSGRWPFTLRLLGNGGLFAGTGIYWNRTHGVFHAYVTSARLQDAVLITTTTHKVVISPEAPQAFLDAMPVAEKH